MMKKYLLLCLVLIVSISAYSQSTSTITITREQLITTNLIFAEHKKLSETFPLLEKQITNLKLVNKSWERTDSINKIQLLNYSNIIEDKNKSIEKLNKSLKKKQNIIKYGGTASILILLCLMLR